jgi:hypothetical protein
MHIQTASARDEDFHSHLLCRERSRRCWSAMTLLYGLLRLESDKRLYHLQRGSIPVTG